MWSPHRATRGGRDWEDRPNASGVSSRSRGSRRADGDRRQGASRLTLGYVQATDGLPCAYETGVSVDHEETQDGPTLGGLSHHGVLPGRRHRRLRGRAGCHRRVPFGAAHRPRSGHGLRAGPAPGSGPQEPPARPREPVHPDEDRLGDRRHRGRARPLLRDAAQQGHRAPGWAPAADGAGGSTGQASAHRRLLPLAGAGARRPGRLYRPLRHRERRRPGPARGQGRGRHGDGAVAGERRLRRHAAQRDRDRPRRLRAGSGRHAGAARRLRGPRLRRGAQVRRSRHRRRAPHAHPRAAARAHRPRLLLVQAHHDPTSRRAAHGGHPGRHPGPLRAGPERHTRRDRDAVPRAARSA